MERFASFVYFFLAAASVSYAVSWYTDVCHNGSGALKKKEENKLLVLNYLLLSKKGSLTSSGAKKTASISTPKWLQSFRSN